MSFLSDLLKKLKKRTEPKDRASEAERSAPVGSDELRFRARTGDPKLTDRHRSGKF